MKKGPGSREGRGCLPAGRFQMGWNMRQGFIKVAAATPRIRVADPAYNAKAVCEKLREVCQRGAKIAVFPELCLTGYTCGDLFLQRLLLEGAQEALLQVREATEGQDTLVFVGLPMEREGRLYNVAAALSGGRLLGFVPKVNIPNYAEFYEARYFARGNREPVKVIWQGQEVPFGADLLFTCESLKGLTVACEICEDLWVACPPSTDHALMGAAIIVNLSASDETVGKDAYREMLVKSASARALCGYVYASAGEGESTQDVVFGGHNLIAENGTLLAQSKPFAGETVYSDIDIQRLETERRRMNTFRAENSRPYWRIPFALRIEETRLDRTFEARPFVPGERGEWERRCEEILSIQSFGLKKRYEHAQAQGAVIGVSGGLDSTLALLVTVRAFDMLGWERKRILAVTMPCFGTTDRTYANACQLARVLGASLREVDIRESVTRHFLDIGQDMENRDVTYENGQARERTQVLMDLANQTGGLVIGTGDMSELALGWATYNGDHMSMYGVNAGVPKTLVRHLVQYYADTCGQGELRKVLLDVLDTPVSPELLPPAQGQISQRTEDLVGPYELHDFFLYYMLRLAYPPDKIYRIAREAFRGLYTDREILKWLQTFYRRFFAQQFKRSCLPDGPKVGSVALSPRGDLRMPSDASAALWLEQVSRLS